MRIKILKFEVSNGSRKKLTGDEKCDWFKFQQRDMISPEQIENTANQFCDNHKIINISINNVDVQYHNNARGNTIELWYTIQYDERV